MTMRRVWTVDEIEAILHAVAVAGGDARTLCAVAVALGIEPRRMLSVAEKENIRSNNLSIARNDVIMTRR